MRASEIRVLSDEALLDAIEDQRAALFNMRFQMEVGQLEDTNLLGAAKRELARLLTIKRERELAAMVAEEGSNG